MSTDSSLSVINVFSTLADYNSNKSNIPAGQLSLAPVADVPEWQTLFEGSQESTNVSVGTLPSGWKELSIKYSWGGGDGASRSFIFLPRVGFKEGMKINPVGNEIEVTISTARAVVMSNRGEGSDAILHGVYYKL